MDAMAEIRATFFEECVEQLGELETGLLAMENGEADSDTVNAVFRAVHSVKGGAGAFNLNDLVHFAHIFETTLDEVRSDRLEATGDVVKIMLRAADVLADLITVARDGGAVDAARTKGLVAELKDLVPGAASARMAAVPEPAEEDEDSLFPAGGGDGMDGFDFVPVAIDFDDLMGGAVSGFRITFKPSPDMYAKANESARLIRELGTLGSAEVECDTSETPLLGDLDPEGAFLTWTVTLTTEAGEDAVREIFEFAEFDCALTVEPLIAENPDGPDDDGGDEVMDPEIAALLARMMAGGGAEDPDAAPALASELPVAASSALDPPVSDV